jgi:hypothetical protein
VWQRQRKIGATQGTAPQAAEKAAVVIPNRRRLRVRDLLFAKRARKKQIPHPVKNQTGFGMTHFHSFRSPFSRAVGDSYQPASAAEGRLTRCNTDNGFGAEVVQRDSTVLRQRRKQ